jgi:hypothetical protein
LTRLLSPISFWLPEYDPIDRINTEWKEHIPFAFWLCDALRPRRFVELGAYSGTSYFAFCQAIKGLGLETQAWGIDHWLGDKFITYDNGDTLYKELTEYNRKYEFSTLVRSSFQDALQRFDDCSIDLLHVDGSHHYEQVKVDTLSWLPKLTDDCIILFHDTRLGSPAGVGMFFEQLSQGRRSFEFFHSSGLGILALRLVPDRMQILFDANRAVADRIRHIYWTLGFTIDLRSELVPEEREKQMRVILDGALPYFENVIWQ